MNKDELLEVMRPLRENGQCLEDCTFKMDTDEAGDVTVTFPVCHGHFHCLGEILTHLKK